MEISLHVLVLESGERLPVLVDSHGIPLQFPLMFSFRDRDRGGVERLKMRLRRIRELYRVFAESGINLDEAILSRDLDVRDVESAIYWLEEEASTQAESEPVSAGTRNQRAAVWSDFIGWAIETANWTYRSHPEQDERERNAAKRLCILLDDLRLPVTFSRQVYPLSVRELEVLDDLLGPGEDGSFGLSPFSKDAARRTWILYQLLRWSGMRIGESLKLRIEDIPARESDVDALIREVDGGALSVTITRRVDDREDSRTNEPGVKRMGRSIPMPDIVLHELWDYIAELPGTTPYLIRTADGTRPLSYSQASKLCYDIRPHAAKLFEERHPGDPHSFNELGWHRLRHTRAVEMLPVYFPDNRSDPISIQRFCEAFGWARL